MFTAIKRISSKFTYYRKCSTAPAIQTERKSLGFARAILCGKVVRDPHVFENGTKSILLQSHSDVGYSINRVYTNSNLNITAGQYLYAAGSLNSEEFKTVDGKMRHQYNLHANDLTVIGESFKDKNSVELRAVVTSDIINTNEFSLFHVLTTYISKWKAEPVACKFTVRAYDEELRDLVRNQVKVKNIIRLFGELCGEREVDQNQKNRKSSFIRASSLLIPQPWDKRASTADEDSTLN